MTQNRGFPWVANLWQRKTTEGNMHNTFGHRSDWQARTYRRFELAFPVRMNFQAGSNTAEIDGVSKNVSIGGLLVRSARPIPPQTPVTFVLSVHGKEGVRPLHLLGQGQIVRMEPDDQQGFALAVRCNAPVTELEDYLPS